MASSNALLRWRKLQRLKKLRKLTDEEIDGDLNNESRPLLTDMEGQSSSGSGLPKKPVDYFDISERIEMGQMVSLYFNKVGKVLFYLCIAIYLYGDLAIYAAAVPKSLRDVACTVYGPNHTVGSENARCWPSSDLTRYDAYRLFVGVFAVTLGPFVFFTVQKTKYLQTVTTVLRWAAFILMISLSIVRLSEGRGTGQPVVGEVSGVPNLFGVCIYSFMCHHSLPSLVTPIRDKSKLSTLLAADYVLILVFYMLLSMTAIYAFSDISDLYTLNFEYVPGAADPVTTVVPFQYFLALFPVFTLSTNFPIIAITLRNNLRMLFLSPDGRSSSGWVSRVVFPLLTVCPPLAVAMATHDLEFLVGVTGSYAGVGVQYVFPALLVYYSRRDLHICYNGSLTNKHSSPFVHRAWIYFTVAWAAACIVFVTANHIMTSS